jgi:hypothetical protein
LWRSRVAIFGDLWVEFVVVRPWRLDSARRHELVGSTLQPADGPLEPGAAGSRRGEVRVERLPGAE